ncbi:MAG: 2-amino-4-hydroxy-6-hydroxymethyldihydropteridine diphosphokinase [Thiothrix sp.]|uniref:2-amino-4-hydroxy-6- hydroxymethyldihydropteridine diphosphokinase n=1 Tax=Thiothrix sp. TaxID=1032 RepID=UPI0026162466|nr:2-amino-4-hydroxy-6-hydroxymethyldihydropteridine diphosphokinase [Thiothrix sp.]MDD5392208.1 2-amino-4-hydroxy-6-hydroxymethyldihydropteridine diphosphokinase [Thiothrix sp.]
MASVYVSIGSNIERESNIRSCMQCLQADFTNVTFSSIYETPAIGFNGNPFFNLVAGFTTEFDPSALRDYLRKLEDAHGRVRNQDKYSARTLDVDLLLYDGLNLQPEINLPHSDILAYPFVLFPLTEIAPNVLHPTLGRSLSALASESNLDRESLRLVALDGKFCF